MKHYIICGNYGAGNLGDEAILRGILYDLENISSGGKVTIFSGDPSATKVTYKDVPNLEVDSVAFMPSGIKSLFKFLSKKNRKGTIEALKKADVFILGGGGLFTDDQTWKAVFIWFIQALAAKLYKKKIVIYGNSVGPLRSTLARILTRKAFLWAEKITVRDEESAKRLKKLGIEDGKVTITADPALNISYLLERKSRKKEILSEIQGEQIEEETEEKTDQKKYAVISLRYLERTNKLYEKAVIDFINHLISQNDYQVYLKPFGGGIISDQEYLNKLIDQNELDKNSVHVHKNNSLKETLDLIKGADFLLGMRLHSLIFATLVGTPFIGLSYSEKVRNFARSLNLEDFVLSLKETSTDTLLKTHGDLQKYEKHIKTHLVSELATKKSLLDKNRKILQSV
ncbi:hypothetical protein HOG48_01815 [Candidatus Peregrinibacteria bacterium]|jgi:polysaccharide pyruvyl transferase CsaB|nr:hypothetical protein [Candidatus Peregrinibacteria bacterium]